MNWDEVYEVDRDSLVPTLRCMAQLLENSAKHLESDPTDESVLSNLCAMGQCLERSAHHASVTFNVERMAFQCSSAPRDNIGRPKGKWTCKNPKLQLYPAYGSFAPTIIVPRGCILHGDGGHTDVIEQHKIR